MPPLQLLVSMPDREPGARDTCRRIHSCSNYACPGHAEVVYRVSKLLRFECVVGRGMNCLLVFSWSVRTLKLRTSSEH